MAPHAGLVIGVENNKQSVINARDNAYQNKVKNNICDGANTYTQHCDRGIALSRYKIIQSN